MPDKMISASAAEVATFVAGYKASTGSLGKQHKVLSLNSLSRNHSLLSNNAVITV